MDLHRLLKKMNIKVLSINILLLSCSLLACTKVELDEKEKALVAKQELADHFDKLFYEGFENPDETEKNLREFELNKLITNDKNLLADQDIRVNKSMIEMTIRLRRIQDNLENEFKQGNIFDMYTRKHMTMLNCRSVLQELPYRARTGKKYEYLIGKVNEIEKYVNQLTQKKIEPFRLIPNELLGKQWKWKLDIEPIRSNTADLNIDPYTKLKNFSFDFHFNKDNTITAKRFFLAPIIIDGLESFDSAGDWRAELMGDNKISFFVQDNKIFLYIPMIDNANTYTGAGNVAHSWVYEYNYKVSGNELNLEVNRVCLYIIVNQFISSKKDFTEYTEEAFKSFTLTGESL